MRKLKTKVLILDYWSDHNRGDAAMQLGLIGLVRKFLPESEITIMAAIGANQKRHLSVELDETVTVADAVIGGLRDTNINFGRPIAGRRLIRKFWTLAYFVKSVLFLPLLIGATKSEFLFRILPTDKQVGLDSLKNTDVLLWNGRNFRSDRKSREFFEFWPLLYVPLIAVLSGKRIACIGASIWPVKSSLARKLLKFVLDRTYFLSVRESSSLFEAKNLKLRNTELALLPDLSLAYLQGLERRRGQTRKSASWPRNVGITLVDWPNSGVRARLNYIEAVRNTCEWLIKNGTELIEIIPQVTFHAEESNTLASELEAVSTNKVKLLKGTLKVNQLVEKYANLDLLLATRMHSAIFSVSQSVPTVVIPYDVGGKWGILNYMGLLHPGIPYSEVRDVSLQKLIQETWLERSQFMDRVKSQMEITYSEVDQNVIRPLTILGLLDDK